MQQWTISDLYDAALKMAADTAHSNIFWGAIIAAIAVGLACFIFVQFWAQFESGRNKLISVVISSVIIYTMFSWNMPARVEVISRDQANIAITSGVDSARKAQSTELQYIHAVVSGQGFDIQYCERTVNSHDFCSNNTPYYNHREINKRTWTTRDCDSNGENCVDTQHESHDDEYVPWFKFVIRYWFVADTKAKYLANIYDFVPTEDGNMNSKPKVFLHKDWRAPEDAENQKYSAFEYVGQYENHVPEFWVRVKNAGSDKSETVVATFVGPYFHWGFGANSPLYVNYSGHYDQLKNLVQLPGPTGASINYTNAFNQPATMNTLLTSMDSDAGFDFNAVSVLCPNMSEEQVAALNRTAISFQGIAGPQKETSIRWFIVCDSVVSQMGGIIDTTQAIKAYMDDESVWGHFRLPKNQLIIVTQVTDDGTMITGRDLETGMPMGNVLVARDMRLSVTSENPIPFTPENMFGTFTGSYIDRSDGAGSATYSYSYPDMSSVGGAIAIIYQQTPGFTPPDPNSDECSTAPAEHHGFIRYQMCTQNYLQSTIKVNSDGAGLIVAAAKAGADALTPMWLAWTLLVLSLIFGGFTIYAQSR